MWESKKYIYQHLKCINYFVDKIKRKNYIQGPEPEPVEPKFFNRNHPKNSRLSQGNPEPKKRGFSTATAHP